MCYEFRGVWVLLLNVSSWTSQQTFNYISFYFKGNMKVRAPFSGDIFVLGTFDVRAHLMEATRTARPLPCPTVSAPEQGVFFVRNCSEFP